MVAYIGNKSPIKEERYRKTTLTRLLPRGNTARDFERIVRIALVAGFTANFLAAALVTSGVFKLHKSGDAGQTTTTVQRSAPQSIAGAF